MKTGNYINSFYNEKVPQSVKNLSGDFIENYKGYNLYRYTISQYHIVKDGVCIGMFAGLNGAKREIDNPKCNKYLLGLNKNI